MKIGRYAAVLTIAVILVTAAQTQAIVKVAPKMNLIEFRGGYGAPLGNYDALPGFDFIFDPNERIEFEADRVYNGALTFGVSYGRLVGRNWLMSVGFDYVRSKIENPIEEEIGPYLYSIEFIEDPTFQQFDISLKGLFMPIELASNPVSPFFGLGVSGGLSSLTAPNAETETEATFALSLDFGIDLKVWEASDGRSFMTLSSINSWDFAASAARPKLLRVGGGIRYFFKP